ncbi:protein of GDPGTP exchange factor Sec2p family [Pseudohyphozyma bogoriensis]|nr:protein of GDPGTP exchange factor Sec2p family [Pseudohyphozyma bogoriensis]
MASHPFPTTGPAWPSTFSPNTATSTTSNGVVSHHRIPSRSDRTYETTVAQARELWNHRDVNDNLDQWKDTVETLLGVVDGLVSQLSTHDELAAQLKIAQSNLTLAETHSEFLEETLRRQSISASTPSSVGMAVRHSTGGGAGGGGGGSRPGSLVGLGLDGPSAPEETAAGGRSFFARIKSTPTIPSGAPLTRTSSTSPVPNALDYSTNPADWGSPSPSEQQRISPTHKAIQSLMTEVASLKSSLSASEEAKRNAESKCVTLEKTKGDLMEELEKLSVELFSEANRMVGEERKTRAGTEEKLRQEIAQLTDQVERLQKESGQPGDSGKADGDSTLLAPRSTRSGSLSVPVPLPPQTTYTNSSSPSLSPASAHTSAHATVSSSPPTSSSPSLSVNSATMSNTPSTGSTASGPSKWFRMFKPTSPQPDAATTPTPDAHSDATTPTNLVPAGGSPASSSEMGRLESTASAVSGTSESSMITTGSDESHYDDADVAGDKGAPNVVVEGFEEKLKDEDLPGEMETPVPDMPGALGFSPMRSQDGWSETSEAVSEVDSSMMMPGAMTFPSRKKPKKQENRMSKTSELPPLPRNPSSSQLSKDMEPNSYFDLPPALPSKPVSPGPSAVPPSIAAAFFALPPSPAPITILSPDIPSEHHTPVDVHPEPQVAPSPTLSTATSAFYTPVGRPSSQFSTFPATHPPPPPVPLISAPTLPPVEASPVLVSAVPLVPTSPVPNTPPSFNKSPPRTSPSKSPTKASSPSQPPATRKNRPPNLDFANTFRPLPSTPDGMPSVLQHGRASIATTSPLRSPNYGPFVPSAASRRTSSPMTSPAYHPTMATATSPSGYPFAGMSLPSQPPPPNGNHKLTQGVRLPIEEEEEDVAVLPPFNAAPFASQKEVAFLPPFNAVPFANPIKSPNGMRWKEKADALGPMPGPPQGLAAMRASVSGGPKSHGVDRRTSAPAVQSFQAPPPAAFSPASTTSPTRPVFTSPFAPRPQAPTPTTPNHPAPLSTSPARSQQPAPQSQSQSPSQPRPSPSTAPRLPPLSAPPQSPIQTSALPPAASPPKRSAADIALPRSRANSNSQEQADLLGNLRPPSRTGLATSESLDDLLLLLSSDSLFADAEGEDSNEKEEVLAAA